MKKTLNALALICSMTCAFAANAALTKQPLDQVVAVVNDDLISGSELNKAVANAKVMIAHEHAAEPTQGALKKQVLDQLINKKIQLQIAKQAGVMISNTDIDGAIKNIATQNHMSTDELYSRVTQDGMTRDEYRNEIRDQMTMQKLQQQEVASKMSISPQEITNFMHSRAWQTSANKEYHLQDILVPIGDTPSTEEIQSAKKRADDILIDAKVGKTFEEISAADTDTSQPLQGGDLGWRQIPEIPAAFSEKVVHMTANAIEGPIQTPNGFHIIRLVASRPLSAKQLANSRKMIESQLMQQKFEEAVHNWVSKLRSQAFVVVNA